MSTQQDLLLSGDNALAVRESRSSSPVPVVAPTPLADLRQHALSVPVEVMQAALAEYKDRRTCMRDWLRSQLVEGVHYGYPPGCEPKYDERGWVGVWSQGGTKYFPPSQWTAKPSLYKAGADFVCDLMGVRDEYRADMDGWAQLGSKTDIFVYGCYLISRASGELIGEGRGVRKVGEKKGNENNAIKMAKKSAKVDAVLNAYGLADLFTQDLEDGTHNKPQHENPEQTSQAPPVTGRGERKISGVDVAAVVKWFKQIHKSQADDVEAWKRYVANVTGEEFDVTKVSGWTHNRIELVEKALEEDERNA